MPDAVYITNKPLPISTLKNLETNTDFYTELKKGKTVAIFLITGCDACKKDVTLISNLYSKSDFNFKIYGISIESEDKVKKYIEQNNVKFPILIDKKGQLLKNLSVKYFPTKFLIEDGIITKTVIGNSPNKDKFLQDFNLEEIY